MKNMDLNLIGKHNILTTVFELGEEIDHKMLIFDCPRGAIRID